MVHRCGRIHVGEEQFSSGSVQAQDVFRFSLRLRMSSRGKVLSGYPFMVIDYYITLGPTDPAIRVTRRTSKSNAIIACNFQESLSIGSQYY